MRNSRWYIVFLLSLIFFSVSLDLIVGTLYKSLYFSERSQKNDRLIHSVKHASEDILIFGSSRALHHYNPELICKKTGMTAYNLGSGGQNIYFHLALLQSVLERHKPKHVILELLSIDFTKTPSQWNTEKLGVLLPFAGNSNACLMAVLRRGELEHLKMLSNIYPFNSLQWTIFRNIAYPLNNDIKGFIPIK